MWCVLEIFKTFRELEVAITHSYRREAIYNDICKKSYNSSTLRLHLRTHAGKLPFCCDVCKKAFNRSSSLKLHQWTHIGERPITCDICKKSFKMSVTLKLHLCPHIEEWLFTCDMCGNLSNSQILWRCIYAIIQGRSRLHVMYVTNL